MGKHLAVLGKSANTVAWASEIAFAAELRATSQLCFRALVYAACRTALGLTPLYQPKSKATRYRGGQSLKKWRRSYR